MTEKVCLKIIANKYDSLSAVERALCDYILKNPSEVLKMTAAEFGRAAGSAPASIIRLCRDLGFEGFTDFKISLALSLGGDEALVLPEVKETDTTEEIFRKVFASGINTLNDTMKMFDVGMLDKAVDMLFGSRNIAFYGEGTSGTIARDAYHRLMRLDCRVVRDGGRYHAYVRAKSGAGRYGRRRVAQRQSSRYGFGSQTGKGHGRRDYSDYFLCGQPDKRLR